MPRYTCVLFYWHQETTGTRKHMLYAVSLTDTDRYFSQLFLIQLRWDTVSILFWRETRYSPVWFRNTATAEANSPGSIPTQQESLSVVALSMWRHFEGKRSLRRTEIQIKALFYKTDSPDKNIESYSGLLRTSTFALAVVCVGVVVCCEDFLYSDANRCVSQMCLGCLVCVEITWHGVVFSLWGIH